MRRKPVNESDYYATEMTDAELDAHADAGEFYLDTGVLPAASPEDVQTMMEEGQQMLNDALWRQMNEEI
jgi:hypothetical protein